MRECRTYETTTDGLLALLEWLRSSGCSVAAMEATGVYWLPVWKVLGDGDFELVLANAAHVEAVPGRKTGHGRAGAPLRTRAPASPNAPDRARAPVVEDRARPVRLGGQERQNQRLPGAVPAPQSPARPEKAICAVAASSRRAQQAFGEETVLRLDPWQDEEIPSAYRFDVFLELLAVEARLHGEKARGEVRLEADEQ